MKIDFTAEEVYYIARACFEKRYDMDNEHRITEKEDAAKICYNILKKLGNAAKEEYE